jgi:hypothetical protein
MPRRAPIAPPSGAAESTPRLAAVTQQTSEEPSFFEQLQQFSADDWRGLSCYVYRLWPVIDRKEGQHYLSKVSEPFDEDFLLATFGTGKYYMRLNDRKGKTLASHTSSVYSDRFPPKVHPEEVVAGDPQNERYFQAWGAKRKTDEPSGDDTNSAAVALAKEAMKSASQRPTLEPQLVDMWEKTTRERDELARKLAETNTRTGTAPDGFTMLREAVGLLKDLRADKPAEPPQRGLIEQAKDMSELLSLVRGMMPEAQPATTSDSIIPSIVSALGPIVAPTLQMITAYMFRPQATAAPGVAAVPPAPVVPDLPAVPPAAPVAQPSATVGLPGGSASPLGLAPEMEALYRLSERAIRAFRRNISGDVFAESLTIEPEDEQLYNGLVELKREGILMALDSIGLLATFTEFERIKLEEWLADFLAFAEPATPETLQEKAA